MNEDVRLNTHVTQMLESVELAMSYVDGLSQADFIADRRTQQAAVLNLIVIGEIATKSNAIFRSSLPGIRTFRGRACAACVIASRMDTLKLIFLPCGTRSKRRCPSCLVSCGRCCDNLRSIERQVSASNAIELANFFSAIP